MAESDNSGSVSFPPPQQAVSDEPFPHPMDSDHSSSVCYPQLPLPTPAADPSASELVALRALSAGLSLLFRSSSHSDASISISDTVSVPVHRCILSARSPFFSELFSRPLSGESPTLRADELLPSFPVGEVPLRYVLSYLYSGRVDPLPHDSSRCADDDCRHVGCRPAVDFMLEILYASFVFQIFELVSLFQRRLMDILGEVGEDELLPILSVSEQCGRSCEKLHHRTMELVAGSGHDLTTLEKAFPSAPALKQKVLEARGPRPGSEASIHVKRIHRALDSDDVELLRLLLKENATTLDDAHALHYAVAYCDSKITSQLLELGLADVNRKNPRGYTVLHLAAVRQEPNVILTLLSKGARPSETTPDGRKALQIAKQVTRYSDFVKPLKNGSETPMVRLCVEILQNAEENVPGAGEASDIFHNAGNNLKDRLSYLETRVSLAKLFFPSEARIAMENARIKGTVELRLAAQNISRELGGCKEEAIDNILSSGRQSSHRDNLNLTPLMNQSEITLRAMELSRTIETAKKFFPRCTKVIDTYMDHDTTDLGDQGTEQKRKRYEQLQQEFYQAFYLDREQLNASSSSSSAPRPPRRKLR